MPYDSPDPDDPQLLVGVEAEASAGTMREMAYVFAEEFARLGLCARQIEALFRSPEYSGAHRAWLSLGTSSVGAIIGECVAVWGSRPVNVIERRKLPVVAARRIE